MKLADLDEITDYANIRNLVAARTGLFAGATELLADLILEQRALKEAVERLEKHKHDPPLSLKRFR